MRLGVGPYRVVELEVEERREQNAPTGGVEDGGEDHADRHGADEERRERPRALRQAAQQKRGQMPDSPYHAQDQPRPQRRKLSLQQRERQPPPAELLHGPLDQREQQRRKQRAERVERKRPHGQLPPQRRGREVGQRNAEKKEEPPPCRTAHEQQASEIPPKPSGSGMPKDDEKRRYRRGIDGENKERMVAAQLSEDRDDPFRKEREEDEDSPRQPERDQQKGREGGEGNGARCDVQ